MDELLTYCRAVTPAPRASSLAQHAKPRRCRTLSDRVDHGGRGGADGELGGEVPAVTAADYATLASDEGGLLDSSTQDARTHRQINDSCDAV